MVAGLIIGEKQEINETTVQDFKNSNLSHMLAISGAHVSYLILGVSFLLEKIKLSKRYSKILLICFFLFFMALVDFTASATRACIMVILQLVASLCFRKSDVYNNLAISSLLIISFNPYSILDIGFQLSFGGTIGIIFFYKPLLKWAEQISKWIECRRKSFVENNKMIIKSEIILINKNRWHKERNIIDNKQNRTLLKEVGVKILDYAKQTILVTISANLIIFPMMIYHFNQLSTVFLISNLLAAPILGISIILSLLVIILSFIFLPLAQILSYLLAPILQLLTKMANIIGNIPFANLFVLTPSIISILIYYFFLILQLKKEKLKKQTRKIASHSFVVLVLLIFLFTFLFNIIPSPYLKIFFIDVGQGDATLIQTPNHKNILIDGGGSEFGSFDVGEQTLLPYLLDKKITTIDYMIFSHLDSDHCKRVIYHNEKMESKKSNY